MNKEEKQTYGVFILRRNQDHIHILESENYDEAYESWKELKAKWETSLHEQKPFELNKPVVTAFDPGLIYEITLRPLTKSARVSSNNPYQQQMEKEGFGNTFGRTGLFDQGYKL
jgi:hypothetical protein